MDPMALAVVGGRPCASIAAAVEHKAHEPSTRPSCRILQLGQDILDGNLLASTFTPGRTTERPSLAEVFEVHNSAAAHRRRLYQC